MGTLYDLWLLFGGLAALVVGVLLARWAFGPPRKRRDDR